MNLEVELETLLVGQNEGVLDVEVVWVVGIDNGKLGGLEFCKRREEGVSEGASRRRRGKSTSNEPESWTWTLRRRR